MRGVGVERVVRGVVVRGRVEGVVVSGVWQRGG